MTVLTAQIILRTVDNLPANFVTNTLHFDSDDVGTAPTVLTPIVEDFYQANLGIIPTSIAEPGHQIKWYVTDQPTPNYPYETTEFVLGGFPAQPPLPSEVALCVSFESQKLNGVSQASRRGRIYFGPLATNIVSDGRPNNAAMITMGTAFQTMVFDALSSGNVLGVWSTKLQTFAPFANGWIDNAFDTQRRRGVEPTSRITWALGDPPS